MTKLEKAKQILEESNASLVVIKEEKVSTYERPGIQDLIQILKENENAMQGATIADKVIGKVAAAIMIEAGVSEIYTFKLSQLAKQLLEENRMVYQFQEEVEFIQNRDKTGMCPMEARFLEEKDTKKIYKSFIEEK